MENQDPLILDISSDEEAGFADARKGGGFEFGDRDDVDWLSKLLLEVGGNIEDDSDDVVFVSEVFGKTPKKSKSESLKPLAKVLDDDDDDDDCMVLDGDPDKSTAVANFKVDGGDDSDDLEIVGEKGEVACRDFPHPRHDCAKHPFVSTAHDVHCGQCHCYVCDSLAPCSYWGTGLKSTDHCHASDKEEYWKAERKNVKKGDKPNSDIHGKGGTRLESFFQSIQVLGHAPALPNSLPQNQTLNPAAIRPCALSSNVSSPNAINLVRSQLSGYAAPRYNPRSQLVSVQSQPRSTNTVAAKVAFRNRSYHVGSQNPQSFPPRAVFKRSGSIGASTNNRHAYRFQLPLSRRSPAFQAPNGRHGSNQQTVGSQGAVSSIPQSEFSSHYYMDAARANYLPSEPQRNSQPCSSYQNPGMIPHQSQTFMSGNSQSSPTLQSYIYSQPSMGKINNSVAPEPYVAYVPIDPLPSPTVASYQSDSGNAFSNQLHSGSGISSHSSLGNDLDSGSSQLQEHSSNSLLSLGQNDVQLHCTQSGMDASPTDFGFLCDSSVNHGKMQVHAKQTQHPNAAPAGTSPIQDTVDILSGQSVEVELAAAANAPPINDADSRLPESKEPGSTLDFNFLDSWMFDNQSFSGAVEESTSLNWNIYSPEPAFTDTGTLFDI